MRALSPLSNLPAQLHAEECAPKNPEVKIASPMSFTAKDITKDKAKPKSIQHSDISNARPLPCLSANQPMTVEATVPTKYIRYTAPTAV